MIEDLSFAEVIECVNSAVPDIADHIIEKMNKNIGFNDNPQAVHPVTKLLTLSLDNNTRLRIEHALSTKSEDPEAFAKMIFIRASMSTINYFKVSETVPGGTEEEIWYILDNECVRDGTLFLQKMKNKSLIPGELSKILLFLF